MAPYDWFENGLKHDAVQVFVQHQHVLTRWFQTFVFMLDGYVSAGLAIGICRLVTIPPTQTTAYACRWSTEQGIVRVGMSALID